MATKAMARVETSRPAMASAGLTDVRRESARARPSGWALAAGNVDLAWPIELTDQALQAVAEDHLLAAKAAHASQTVIGAGERAGRRYLEFRDPDGTSG